MCSSAKYFQNDLIWSSACCVTIHESQDNVKCFISKMFSKCFIFFIFFHLFLLVGKCFNVIF